MKKYILVFTFVVVIISLFPSSFVSAKTTSLVPELESAINKLQEQMKALQSEITNLQSQLELAKVAEIKFTKTLKKGMSGKDVKNLQQFLKNYEFYTGRITGNFDLRTVLAVKKIQKQLGLKQTGIVNAKTRLQFNELLAEEEEEEDVAEITSPTTITSTTSTALITQLVYPVSATATTTTATTSQLLPAISPATSTTPYTPPISTYTPPTYTSAPSTPSTPTTTSTPTTPVISTTSTSTITVVYPNSGEQLIIGNSYEIRWSSTGIENVYIDLVATSTAAFDHPNSLGTYTISSSAPAAVGSYWWQITPGIASGNGYRIRVVSQPILASGAWLPGINYDTSNYYFSITAPIPTITVTSPNGGEQFTAGSTYQITWTSTNLDRAYLYYKKEADIGMSHIGTVDTPSGSGGSYSWTVPSNLVPGNYKIVVGGSTPDVADTSNNYFSISVPVVLGAPPIGYWKFDGNGNNEISGGPNAAVVGNAVFNASGGKLGGYAYIPSSSDYIRIPYNSAFDLPDAFTIEFWFRQRSNQSFFQDLVYKGSALNNYNFRIFRQLWNEYNFGPIITGYTSPETGWWTQTSNPNQLSHNVWHHVAFVKGPSWRAYYLDGVEIHSGTDSPSAKTPATDIIIGDSAVDTDIDNLKIYNRPLSYGEVLQDAGLALENKNSPRSMLSKVKSKISKQQLANVAASISQLVAEIKKLLGK